MRSRAYAPPQTSAGTGLTPVLTGTVIALICCLVLSFVAALMLAITPLAEQTVPALSMIATLISIFLGAAVAARKARVSGWLHGGLTGIAVVVVVWIIGALGLAPSTSALAMMLKLSYGFGAGAAGGIFGISL